MLSIRVYYQDTDYGGVVYYANYLGYFERGRTEFLRERNISLPGCHEKGILFVVTRTEVDYLSPARYNDLLLLETKLINISKVTMTFGHSVKKEGSEKELVRGTVSIAAVNRDGRPLRIPEDIRVNLAMSVSVIC